MNKIRSAAHMITVWSWFTLFASETLQMDLHTLIDSITEMHRKFTSVGVIFYRASVRRTYAVYYVQKSAVYAEITHQRRPRTSENSSVLPKIDIETSCRQKKTRPHLPDYVIYVPPSYWRLIYFVYWPR